MPNLSIIHQRQTELALWVCFRTLPQYYPLFYVFRIPFCYYYICDVLGREEISLTRYAIRRTPSAVFLHVSSGPVLPPPFPSAACGLYCRHCTQSRATEPPRWYATTRLPGSAVSLGLLCLAPCSTPWPGCLCVPSPLSYSLRDIESSALLRVVCLKTPRASIYLSLDHSLGHSVPGRECRLSQRSQCSAVPPHLHFPSASIRGQRGVCR